MDEDPALWIAVKLHENPDSPFLGLVYRGGVRDQGVQRYINLTSFKNGIDLLLNSGTAMNAIPGTTIETVPAKYILIRNYWNAVKKIYSADWNKDSLLLKGVGYRAMSVVGGSIIDRCLAEEHTDSDDMEPLVAMTRKTKFDSGSTLDWSKNGPVSTYGGMKSVGLLAKRILAAIAPVTESTVRSLSAEAGVIEQKN